ncbi:MAG: 4Fe-4S binding protein, partial [Desulfomonilia bacterium]|nr:4Fe-4S binding protein [Desulfomonilia bacterium]
MAFSITDSCNGCQACTKLCPVAAISGKKQKLHRIDETLCIECGACGRICPQGAVLDQFGILCQMVKRSRWKKPVISSTTCMSCTICIDVCPVNCLEMSDARDAKNTHGYAYLARAKECIGCGFCALECPVEAIVME